jgi:hypothetical protein
MQFEVFFEIYGKKMKAVIDADNELQAKKKVSDKIIFHKVVKRDDFADYMKGVFDVFNSVFGGNPKK